MNAFLSYRRAEQDVGIAAWGLAQIMKQRGWTVFMDLEIPPLADWKRILREAVEQSSIMLVAMGPRWAALLNERLEASPCFVWRLLPGVRLRREVVMNQDQTEALYLRAAYRFAAEQLVMACCRRLSAGQRMSFSGIATPLFVQKGGQRTIPGYS